MCFKNFFKQIDFAIIGQPIYTGTATSRVWGSVLQALNDAKVTHGIPKGGKLISGPTMYGLTNTTLQQWIEGLEGADRCKKYSWGSDSESDKDAESTASNEESDIYCPPKYIENGLRRKLEEDILKHDAPNAPDKKTISRYLRYNKKTDHVLLAANTTTQPDAMEVERQLSDTSMVLSEVVQHLNDVLTRFPMQLPIGGGAVINRITEKHGLAFVKEGLVNGKYGQQIKVDKLLEDLDQAFFKLKLVETVSSKAFLVLYLF